MNKILLIVIQFLIVISCQTTNERAKRNPIMEACPNFGMIDINTINKDAIDLDKKEISIKVKNRNEILFYPIKYVTSAIEIDNEKEYLEFKSAYWSICNLEIPFEEKILYIKNVRNKSNIDTELFLKEFNKDQIYFGNISLIGNNCNLKQSNYSSCYIVDLGLFSDAWFNKKDFPNILNSILFRGNEFQYQEIKNKFESIRNKKYLFFQIERYSRSDLQIFNGYPCSFKIGEYNFNKKTLNFDYSCDTFFLGSLYEGNGSGNISLSKSISVTVQPEKARKLIEKGAYVNYKILAEIQTVNIIKNVYECYRNDGSIYETFNRSNSSLNCKITKKNVLYKELFLEPVKWNIDWD